MCGELLISPESAIRHTQGMSIVSTAGTVLNRNYLARISILLVNIAPAARFET